MTRFLSLCFLVISGLFFCGAAAAEDPAQREQVIEELKGVRLRIEETQQRLGEIKRELFEIKKGVEAATSESDRMLRREAELKAESARLEEEIAAVQRSAEEAKKQAAARKSELEARLVAIYKIQRRGAAAGYLFGARSATDLLRRVKNLTAIARHDRDTLAALGKLLLELGAREKRLAALKSERLAKLESVRQLGIALEKKKLAKAALLREAESKRKLEEQTLGQLEKSASRLETILSAVMGEEEAVSSYEGSGFAQSLKEKLPLPVQGKVLQRYGKQRHDEFSDMVFVKGLEFATSTGAEVHPVARGKAVFAQFLPGFGNVVILDHGERYYSLYGRLASMLCKVGDIVGPQETVGVVGEPDHKGRNFYFELRFKGKAVDPTRYFASPPQML